MTINDKQTTQTTKAVSISEKLETKQDLPLVQLRNEARTFYMDVKQGGSADFYISPDESGSYPSYMSMITNRDSGLLVLKSVSNAAEAIKKLDAEGWTQVVEPMVY